jgi:hypothetical protein
VDVLQDMPLSSDNDVFMEILIMSMKNSSLNHQHDFFKIKNAKKKALSNKLEQLNTNFHANVGEILRTERELNRVVEDDMREEIFKMRNFENLNDEKITPYFLSLAKRQHNPESLSDLNRPDGSPFDSVQERNNYIKEYYANTYKAIPGTVNVQSINDFLGPVSGRAEVISSILSETERADLERDLTLAEFDKAVELAKNNTAPGIDSVSNRFIKIFGRSFVNLYTIIPYAATIKAPLLIISVVLKLG